MASRAVLRWEEQLKTEAGSAVLGAKPERGYRADIDGLRAVAVLMVFAYHLDTFTTGNLGVWGGFIGVDVFFVISGYLISSVILREIDHSTFSLAEFYRRRIRRILPALMAMLLATGIAGCYYMLPSQLYNLAKSLLAATLSVSNFYFLATAGYFSSNVDKPLLHTWSLAVEEQFYIFFPILLLLLKRFFPRRFNAAIISVAAASFILSVWAVHTSPTLAFYLPATRAWELLLGAMLALNLFPQAQSAVGRNLLSAVGLLAVLVCGFTYTGSVPFPGAAALVPCLGTAFIIAAGQGGSSIVGRLLSLKPVVFIGLISYSLYLWHWPIILFQHLSMHQPRNASNHMIKGSVVVVAFVVSTISWRFIETPFRKGRFMLKAASAFWFAGGSMALLSLFAGAILVLHGLPSRYTQREIELASYLGNTAPGQEGRCSIEPGGTKTAAFDATHCLYLDPARKNYLLIGDSHAAHLWYGLHDTFPEINFLEASASGCAPLVQGKSANGLFDRLNRHLFGDTCRPLMDYMFQDYLVSHRVDRVMLAARWEEEDLPRLEYTVRLLKARGFEVLLFGPIVQYDSDLPWLLVNSLRRADAELPLRHRLTHYQGLDQQMSALAGEWGVGYVSYFKMLCQADVCTEYVNRDTPLQSDYGHLTPAGSLLVSARLKADPSFRMW
jgi:peptidoglycan/LPS O-acetylase OafA/YrhL